MIVVSCMYATFENLHFVSHKYIGKRILVEKDENFTLEGRYLNHILSTSINMK